MKFIEIALINEVMMRCVEKMEIGGKVEKDGVFDSLKILHHKSSWFLGRSRMSSTFEICF
jgi:hypothetical protein